MLNILEKILFKKIELWFFLLSLFLILIFFLCTVWATNNISDIRRVSPLLANIIEASKENMIHVSGHPARDELAQMYSWVKPRTLIAVHGETRHINEHVSYAKEHQIKFTLPGRNGSLIQLSPGDPRFIGELEHGRLIVDGNDLITRKSDVLKKRHKMMFNGSVFVVLTINKDFCIFPKLL